MIARDLMVPLQEHLTAETNLCEAAAILRNTRRGEETVGVKGLPVIGPGGRMIGFLSIGDILKAVFPPYMTLANVGDFTWDTMVEEAVQRIGGRLVRDVMTTKVVSISEEAPLMACIHRMLRSDVKRLPVTASDGRVVGILYERDIFIAITDVMLGESAAPRA